MDPGRARAHIAETRRRELEFLDVISERTFVERQGDALAEVIRFAANTGKAPIEGGERPHIAVTVSLDTLKTAIGEATLDDGHSLTPEQARRLACDAGIIPMILGTKS